MLSAWLLSFASSAQPGLQPLPINADQTSPSDSASLATLPNTSVRYYDVTGRSVEAINRSIARQRPAGSNGKPVPAATDWLISAGFDQRVEGGQCKVTAARANVSATAELPRLVDEQALERGLQTRWRNYLQQLEAHALATLVFVYQNLGQVEQAIEASTCETAKAAGAAAIERLRREAAAFQAARERLVRKTQRLDEFQTATGKLEQPVCKYLLATGSRVQPTRVCMSPRDWDRLHESGKQATREIQDRPRPNRPF